jgi:hypothetical protein
MATHLTEMLPLLAKIRTWVGKEQRVWCSFSNLAKNFKQNEYAGQGRAKKGVEKCRKDRVARCISSPTAEGKVYTDPLS